MHRVCFKIVQQGKCEWDIAETRIAKHDHCLSYMMSTQRLHTQ